MQLELHLALRQTLTAAQAVVSIISTFSVKSSLSLYVHTFYSLLGYSQTLYSNVQTLHDYVWCTTAQYLKFRLATNILHCKKN